MDDIAFMVVGVEYGIGPAMEVYGSSVVDKPAGRVGSWLDALDELDALRIIGPQSHYEPSGFTTLCRGIDFQEGQPVFCFKTDLSGKVYAGRTTCCAYGKVGGKDHFLVHRIKF